MQEKDSKKKILIVDDQLENLEYLCNYFSKKMNFDVEKAVDGIDALEKLKSFFPDVILLDNIMPRMSGHELIIELKKEPKLNKVPIIMFSAVDNPSEQASCLNLGVEDYIHKPINVTELQKRIIAVVNRES